MARCTYHLDVETELTCTECGIPICPKEMVLTPVGYKCPEHARAKKGQLRYVKPRQAFMASVAAFVCGVMGAVVFGAMPFGIFAGIIWGAITAEAVRRASGGHRGPLVAGIAAAGIGFGWLATLPFGGMWYVVPIVAIVLAVVQLAVFPSR